MKRPLNRRLRAPAIVLVSEDAQQATAAKLSGTALSSAVCGRCAGNVPNADWVCRNCALVGLGAGLASAASG